MHDKISKILRPRFQKLYQAKEILTNKTVPQKTKFFKKTNIGKIENFITYFKVLPKINLQFFFRF
jgi:hypothetical protein